MGNIKARQMRVWRVSGVREIVRQRVGELWFESVNNAQTLKRGGRTAHSRSRMQEGRTAGESHLEKQLLAARLRVRGFQYTSWG